MPQARHSPDKLAALRRQGTLNPHPHAAQHPLFQDSAFFDPADLVQVKYEMLRHAQVDHQPVAQAAKAFGFSRPAFYHTQLTFAHAGFAGLLPQKRGPKGGHKLTADVLAFVTSQRAAEPALSGTELAARVRQQFQLVVHPRSIARQLQREKNAPESHPRRRGAGRLRSPTAPGAQRAPGRGLGPGGPARAAGVGGRLRGVPGRAAASGRGAAARCPPQNPVRPR